MTSPVDLSAFLAGFLVEAEEHLTSASGNLQAVEQALNRSESSPMAVRELFRSLHTIKGLSAMVGVEPIVDLSHVMETVLRAADAGGGSLSAAAVELLSKGLTAIDERVQALSRGVTPKAAPGALLEAFAALEISAEAKDRGVDDFLSSLDPSLASKFTAAERQHIQSAFRAGRFVLRVDFTPSPNRPDGLNINTVRERVGRIAEIVRVFPLSVPKTNEAPGGLTFGLFLTTNAPPEAIAEAAGTTAHAVITLARPAELPSLAELPDDDLRRAPSSGGGYVRVTLARLDDAFENMAGLIVNRFRMAKAVSDLAAKGVDVRELTGILSDNGRQVRDLRASIMRLRMVPTRTLLERVPLLVRGLTRETGKPVRLEVNAGEAELDKAVADRVFPAIVHLVRNAVDHGIESPEARRTAGKSPEGLLRITCSETSNGLLEIVIQDDGRGLDREEVARRANQEVLKDDLGLLELITRPGLSTAMTVTTTSGRGLGMDIVKRVVTGDLGGELSLETRRSAGTTFTLRIPLTITIVDAFTFVAGGERFVTPVGSVEEIVEVEPRHVVDAPKSRPGRGARLLQRRGEALPLFALSDLFALSSRGPPDQLAAKALVVRRHAQRYAFEVERMIGQQEVVVRPLEDPLVRVTGISGSTDLGDGKPTLVLDLVALSGQVSTFPRVDA